MRAHPGKLQDVGHICLQAAGSWLSHCAAAYGCPNPSSCTQLCAHVGSAMSQAAWMKMPSGARLPSYRSSNCCLYSS